MPEGYLSACHFDVGYPAAEAPAMGIEFNPRKHISILNYITCLLIYCGSYTACMFLQSRSILVHDPSCFNPLLNRNTAQHGM